MKKNLTIAVFLCMIKMLTSCGPTLKVTSDYDKSSNFKQYKTFSLYKSDSISSAISALNQQRIRNAIVQEMIKKGFQENNMSPDLLVNPVAIVKNKMAITSNTDYYGYGGVYRPYYWGAGWGTSSFTTYNVQQYKDGSLLIDIIEASSKKLIWQGVGNSEIDGPLKEPDEQIPQAITKIMAGFPPTL